MENFDNISDSMTDKIAPTEADMAQRLQSSTQTKLQSQTTTTTDSYTSSLFSGYDNNTEKNESWGDPFLTDKQPKESKPYQQNDAVSATNSNTDDEESKYLHTLKQVMKDRSAE